MMEDSNNRPADDSCRERMCWEIVESVNSIILRWDTRMRITFANRFALEFFGFSPGEILGRSIIGTIVPPTSTAGSNLEALMQDILRRPEGFVNNENENIRHDGSRVWISWTNRALRDREGKVTEIMSVGNDITGRRQAEEALRRQLEMTQTLLDAIPVPIYYKDTRGVYMGCNRAFADFFGTSKNRIIGRTIDEIAPPDIADVYQKADKELFSRPGRQSYESVVADMRGNKHDVVIVNATFSYEDGAVGGLIGTIIDITERKSMWQALVKARQDLEQRVQERTRELEETNESLQLEAEEHRRDEAALRESEENLARAQMIAHVGIWNWDIEKDDLQWSDETYKMYGASPATFKPTYDKFLNSVIPEDRDRVDRAVRESLREGKHYKQDFYIRRPDGELRYVNCEGGTIFASSGLAIRMLGVCFDITEQKRAEDALRESEERFRATFEQAAVGIAHAALDGHYIRANKKFCDIVRRDCGTLAGRTFQSITTQDDLARQLELDERLKSGKIDKYSMEKRYIGDDGALIWANLTVSLVRDRDGKPKYFMGVVEDITQRKQAEEALKKARARAELYIDLMGHDISNMNQAMMGYLEMAQELLDLKGHEDLIDRPLEIIRHSSRLIASVKKLEQAQSGKYPEKTVDLRPVLEEVVDEYATVPGREVYINYRPAEGYYVHASDLLKDVFDHLVDNAIRHSTGPLRVDLAVEPVVQDGRKYYRVSVTDNGPGIPADLKKKVFRLIDESTGSPGRRGLGLYMVRMLVGGYGGKVWVEDRVPGDHRKGSRFVVLLPAETQG
ncbi:MAG TPA: PAS domain S-box protein [Methanocella sp.]|jgi:PAS domain S-box-containing protein